MELSTAQRLAELNRQFYAEHAENFAEARPRLPAGVQRVLAEVAPGQRILEVGCGDGKVGRALARGVGPTVVGGPTVVVGPTVVGAAAYLGLDLSPAMLDRARRYTEAQAYAGAIQFLLADLTDPAWMNALPAEPFDWALAFAVFHHLPGRALRARVLREMASRVRAGGWVAMSNWQFTRSERLMERVADWGRAGLRAEDVEVGDYLLTWERGGRSGLRYVHLLEEAEARSLAAEAALRVIEVFQADGVSGNLSDYVMMEKKT